MPVSSALECARGNLVSEIIAYVGLGIFIIGGIGLLLASFRTSILWGLAVLFISPVAIIYIIVHWQDAKGPFKIQIFGLIIMAIFLYVSDGINMPSYMNSRFSSSPVISNQQFRPSSLSSRFSSSSAASSQQFTCDGRQHCSQMRSRAEAEFFLRNCPNTKMDGDHDGIPCENDSRF